VPAWVAGSVSVESAAASFAGAEVREDPACRARPKSRILRRPSGVTMTFAGFRSRWTIPAACVAVTPSVTRFDRTARTYLSFIGAPESGRIP